MIVVRHLDQIVGDLPPSRREKVELRGRELVAEEMALRQIRKTRDLTQDNVARRLGINQASISKIEKQGDMLLSTLRGYVEAMDGSLKVTAQFEDGEAIEVTAIGQVGRSKAVAHGDVPAAKKGRTTNEDATPRRR